MLMETGSLVGFNNLMASSSPSSSPMGEGMSRELAGRYTPSNESVGGVPVPQLQQPQPQQPPVEVVGARVDSPHHHLLMGKSVGLGGEEPSVWEEFPVVSSGGGSGRDTMSSGVLLVVGMDGGEAPSYPSHPPPPPPPPPSQVAQETTHLAPPPQMQMV